MFLSAHDVCFEIKPNGLSLHAMTVAYFISKGYSVSESYRMTEDYLDQFVSELKKMVRE